MRANKGFSMVEATIVLVIVALILIVVLPFTLNSFASSRLQAAADVFNSAVQRARFLAASQNEVYCLAVNTTDPHKITVFPDGDWNFASAGGDISFQIDNKVTVSYSFGQCTLPSGAASGVTNIMAFSPDGTLWTRYQTKPPADPLATTSYPPKMQLTTTLLGTTYKVSAYVNQLGQVSVRKE